MIEISSSQSTCLIGTQLLTNQSTHFLRTVFFFLTPFKSYVRVKKKRKKKQSLIGREDNSKRKNFAYFLPYFSTQGRVFWKRAFTLKYN